MAETRADWRRWAIMLILFNRAGPMRTKDILWEIEREGWDVVTSNGRMDQVHNSLLSLMKRVFEGSDVGVKVYRTPDKPAFWGLTEWGRAFVRDNLIDNPHITPEKSRER